VSHPTDGEAGNAICEEPALLLKTLRESPVPVTIVTFGSRRAITVAFNREPSLFRAKVAATRI
jgi:3-polyprenyl-4-hydroxybenzoate decarboxylase